MKKEFKKMKLHELQKESLRSKEMQKIVGGDACTAICAIESLAQEYAIKDYVTMS